MSDISFAQLLEEEEMVGIRSGQIVDGTVIAVKEDEIVLNINYKADGILTRREYSNAADLDLRTVVNVGDTMTVKVLKENDGEGQVLLTYKKIAVDKAFKKLEEAFNNAEILTGKVTKIHTGGLGLDFEGADVFIPASLVSDTFEKNLGKYEGQDVEFVVTEFNPRKRRIIGDRKQILVARKKEVQAALLAKISVGMTVEGTIKNVTDFGAFIDLGGIDGLLHISEMSWGRVDNPKKLLNVGDKISVLIKDIQGEKIALSLKFPETNPWKVAQENFTVGTIITGKVARMTDFGAFVELVPGVDALLHVSQISREHIDKPSDVLTLGQEITAKIVDFNLEAKKISLSIKALEVVSAKEEMAETVEEAVPAEEAVTEE